MIVQICTGFRELRSIKNRLNFYLPHLRQKLLSEGRDPILKFHFGSVHLHSFVNYFVDRSIYDQILRIHFRLLLPHLFRPSHLTKLWEVKEGVTAAQEYSCFPRAYQVNYDLRTALVSSSIETYYAPRLFPSAVQALQFS